MLSVVPAEFFITEVNTPPVYVSVTGIHPPICNVVLADTTVESVVSFKLMTSAPKNYILYNVHRVHHSPVAWSFVAGAFGAKNMKRRSSARGFDPV